MTRICTYSILPAREREKGRDGDGVVGGNVNVAGLLEGFKGSILFGLLAMRLGNDGEARI
jgi:hypothetical protein